MADFSTTVFNSAVITIIKVPLGLFISAMAAYALSRIRLPAGRAVFLLILFGTMLPFQVMLAPLFTLVNSFGLINTKLGIILPYLAFGVPYQVFILHGFFSEMPKELSEAAPSTAHRISRFSAASSCRCRCRSSRRCLSSISSRLGTSSPWRW